jgi:hypothetical protein
VSGRLPTHIEVGGILRRAEQGGGFGTVLRKGDDARGSLLLVIASRGGHHSCLERILDLDGGYQWRVTGPSDSAEPPEVSSFLAKRARFDADLWVIELDVADPERFTAETVAEA